MENKFYYEEETALVSFLFLFLYDVKTAFANKYLRPLKK